MTLQSQATRPLGRSPKRIPPPPRPSSSRRTVGVVLLALLLSGTIIWYVRTHVRAGSGLTPAHATAAAAPNPAPTPAPTTPHPAPPAVTLEMTNTRSATPPREPRQPSAPIASTATPAPPPPAPAPPAAVHDPLAEPASQAASPPPPALHVSINGLPGDLSTQIQIAEQASAAGKPVQARALFNKALLDPRTPAADRAGLRSKLEALNQTLLFSPTINPDDPLTERYTITRGDSLVVITRKRSLATEPLLIQRINALPTPRSLRVGQPLKLLHGPFHAVVHKSLFRMDIFAGPTPALSSLTPPDSTGTLAEGAEPGWIYIRSFRVGLGASGSTPIANFVVKQDSKLVNPAWTNPRTGEQIAADDPKNPIGERWIGLVGADDKARHFTGYGIHGTIDPESIGHEASMGCIRMNADDVSLVYELLMPRISIVKVVP